MEAERKGMAATSNVPVSPAGAGPHLHVGLAIRSFPAAGCRRSPHTSDEAWAWLSGRAFDADFAHRGVAFRLLAKADTERFGRQLVDADWSWQVGADDWMNHYVSMALIAATVGLTYEQIAPRIAPWLLLRAVRDRGASPADAVLAASIFGSMLASPELEAPDPGSQLSIQRERVAADPFAFSITPRLAGQDDDNPLASLRAALDADAQVAARKRAVDTVARIREARASGASLYLASLDPEDFKPIIRHAPEAVVAWLEGAVARTRDFSRRARLAEGVFLALCEALLDVAPDRGAELWRSLRGVLTTHFIGAAEVEEMIHMVFRTPPTPATDALLAERLDLRQSNTDEDLLDLAIAATVNGRIDWLRQAIAADNGSGIAWRRRRALMLEGFSTENALPVADAWPEGAWKTAGEGRRTKAAQRRHSEACARHWWRSYWQAADPESAYAAWTLFLRSADRRALAWLSHEAAELDLADALTQRKVAHAKVNYRRLKSATKEKRSLDDHFLDKRTVDGVGPWGKVRD